MKNKQIADDRERDHLTQKLDELKKNKAAIQSQIEEANRLREEAY